MARPTTAARRYAEAAYELAARDKALDTWRDDLATAAELVGDERIMRLVDNPAKPLPRRVAIIDGVLGTSVVRGVRNLAVLLSERSRIELLPIVAREFRRLYNLQHGVVTAVVTTAAPLTDEELAAIRSRVETMTGATVELDVLVDEGLIGGIAVRVGDRLFDASVRGRLERLRDQLVAGVR